MIVFDASTLVSAALKAESKPAEAFLRADEVEVFALSTAVDEELVPVPSPPKFRAALLPVRRDLIIGLLRQRAV